MKITEINNQAEWETIVSAISGSVFLQSAIWPTISTDKSLRLAVMNDQHQVLAVVQLLTKKVLFGKYLYSPRGPLFVNNLSLADREQVVNELVINFKANKLYHKYLFWRAEPNLAETDWQKFNARKSFLPSIALQPAKTLILDLAKSTDELMEEMHQKTRYNIRLSLKKGVLVRRAGIDEFAKFWNLMQETGSRDAFGIHNRDHYFKMIDKGGNIFRLYLAEFSGQVLAGGIFAFYGDTVTYVHGASSSENRQLMAPYALHWRIIEWAKAGGFKTYDLFGVDKIKWPGVTRFKEGFGGQEFVYPGTIDLVLNPSYYRLYKLLRKLRRLLKFV